MAGNTNYYVRVAPVGSEPTNYRLVLNPGAEIPASSGGTPLLTTQGAQYFKNRPQFYMAQGNGYANSNLGSSLLGNNSWGKEGNCTWYAYGRLKELGFKPGDILTNPVTLRDSNAYQWGNVLNNGARILSPGETPRVGDVAQWLWNSQNHVAIVEKVENGNVWLSESNWATDKDGDKDGDGITKGDGTFHNIVKYSATNPHRYIRLTRA